MKRNFIEFLFKNIYLLCSVAVLSVVTSCKSDKVTEVNVGSFSVYNVSPSFSTYDIYVNNTKFNSAALPFGGGVKYAQTPSGTYTAKLTVAGETNSLYEKPFEVKTNVINTLYITGVTPNFESIYTTDDYPNSSVSKSYVRFINLSPDAPALDLVIKDGSTIATNKAYKTYSSFIEMEPGSKTFDIKTTTGSTTKATIEATTLAAGRFYTIISRGKVTPASSLERSFSGQIILHQ